MDKYDVANLLMQVETSEGAACLRVWLRGHARQAFLQVMEAEVESLCGAIHQPERDSDLYRAGSAPGSVLNEGKKVKVNRPRVRRKKTDGSEEVRLSCYEAGRERGHLEEMFLRALCAGVSTREQKNVHPEAQGNSRSNISRLWEREGAKMLRNSAPATYSVTIG